MQLVPPLAPLRSDTPTSAAGTLDERAAIMLLLLIERCVAAALHCKYVMAACVFLTGQPAVQVSTLKALMGLLT